MPINAHFIQAAKLLTPGASYHADIVLPDIRDLADIAQRVSIDDQNCVVVSSAGPGGKKFGVAAYAPAATTGSEGAAVRPSAIDNAVITALLVDEAVQEFGADRVAAAAARGKNVLDRNPAPAIGRVLGALLGADVRVHVLVNGPTGRLRLRPDGSMAIAIGLLAPR